MPIGPRLDRPSVVGDEGRARETSLAVTTALVAAIALIVGYTGTLFSPLRTLALGIGLVGAGVALFQRDTVSAYFFGHVCFVTGGLLSLLAVGLTAASPSASAGTVVTVAGLGIALLGTAGGWANTVRPGSLRHAAKQGWAAFIAPIVLLSVVGGLFVAGIFWIRVVDYALVPATGPSLSGLALIVGVTALSVRVSLPRLPLRQLASRERRPAVAAAVDEWRWRSRVGIGVGFGGWLLLVTLELAGVTAPLYAAVPGPIAALLASPFLRIPILTVGVLAVGAAAFAWIVRRLARGFGPEETGRLGPVFGTLVFLVLAVTLATAVLLGGVRSGGIETFAAVLGLVFSYLLTAFLVFILLFTLVPALAYAGLLPERAGAPALTAAGLVVVTLGIGIGGAPAPLVFATAAAALVVWDVSEFGTGLTAELGHLPETRRLELLHGVLSVAVAVVAVVTLLAVRWIVGQAAPPAPALPALALAVGGVLALLVPLRG